MFLAFLRLVRRLWSPKSPLLPAPRPRLSPAVEALEDRWLPSTISGLVYFDSNDDGLHQSAEQGLSANTIQLYDSGGTLLATTVTDSVGRYTFATNPTVSPTAKTQEVEVDFAAARTNTTQTQSVAQFDPSLGTLTGVEIINDGTLTSHLKVENDDSADATITGEVHATLSLQAGGLDAVSSTASNSDSATLSATDGNDDFTGAAGRDFGSKSANGTNGILFGSDGNDLSAFLGTGTVSLTESAQVTSSISGAGNLLASVSSQAAAHVRVIYHYEAGAPLAPGDYTVVQPNDPAGYVHGLETADNVSPLTGSDQLNSIAVQLTDSNSLNNNFGERKLSSLAGTVYQDANGNGQHEAAEPPLAGVTLNLSGVNDLGEQISGVQQTGADGAYQFNGLRAGNYLISEVQPAGFLNGSNTPGSLGGNVTDDTISANVPWSATGTGYDFGEVKQSPIPGAGTVTPNVPVDPGLPAMTKRDFIGGAWTKWGW